MGKFLRGWVMGLLIGGVIALLLAPDSGEGTRQRLRERARQMWEELRQAAAEERQRLEAELRKMMDQGSSAS